MASCKLTVHPRIRGEHTYMKQKIGKKCGSSPHPRGTHSAGASGADFHRFIPASAGNTASISSMIQRAPVHPRIRGEHDVDSPAGAECVRFIPASAGNTRQNLRSNGIVAVHPRIRGEHSVRLVDSKLLRGSSPHPRGTQCKGYRRQKTGWFIPASAGNTYLLRL